MWLAPLSWIQNGGLYMLAQCSTVLILLLYCFPPPSARVVRHNVCRVGCLPCVDCAFVSVERVAAVYIWFLNQTNNLFRLSPSSISKFSISKFRIWVTGRSLHLTLFNLTTTSLWWRLHQTHLLHFSTGAAASRYSPFCDHIQLVKRKKEVCNSYGQSCGCKIICNTSSDSAPNSFNSLNIARLNVIKWIPEGGFSL